MEFEADTLAADEQSAASADTLGAPRASPLRPSGPARGDALGRYVVLDRLGAGAMGVVLAAFDPKLERRVAVKLLRGPQSQGSAAAQRLTREAQALARLAHPNVVAVHDVGEHEGQVFVAMEFVNGTTLTDYLESDPPPAWEDVVDKFVAAGRGLAAAHREGVIHRDFKPDNVMLGEDGRVRVMDFGLARSGIAAVEGAEVSEVGAPGSSSSSSGFDERLTEAGALMGTPAYMSPEQYGAGDIDARSDQFSFCVALFHGLYGERPFRGGSLAELAANVVSGRVQEPDVPRSVPAWVRRVVDRGLSVSPADRYPSMQELLEDLTRDPRRARRGAAWAIGTVVVLGGGVMVLSTADEDRCANIDAELSGAWDDAARQRVTAAFEQLALPYGEQARDEAFARLDEYAQDWVALRSSSCEATEQRRLAQRLGDAQLVCLAARRRALGAAVGVLSEADEAVALRANSLVVGLPAIDECRDAERLLAENPPRPDDAQRLAELERTEDELARAAALHRVGRIKEALSVAQPAKKTCDRAGYPPVCATAARKVGSYAADAGQLEDAEKHLDEAYVLSVRHGLNVQASYAAREHIRLFGQLQDRNERARMWALNSEAFAEATDSPTHMAAHLRAVASLDRASGDLDSAWTALQKAKALLEANVDAGDARLANLESELGHVALQRAEYGRAQDHFERSFEQLSAQYGSRYPGLLLPLAALSHVAVESGDLAAALRAAQRAVEIAERAHGTEHPSAAAVYVQRGHVLRRMRRWDEAFADYERALEIHTKRFGDEHASLAPVLGSIGTLLTDQKRYADARPYVQRCLAIAEANRPANHPGRAGAVFEMADNDRHLGHHDEAQRRYRESIEAMTASLGADHPGLVGPLAGLGQSLVATGRPGEAIEFLERALELSSRHEGNVERLARVQFALGDALWVDAAQRSRARELVGTARATFVTMGAAAKAEASATQRWLSEHVIGTP